MKDILKKYKKHIIISNIGIIAASFVVAIGVNFFLIDGTQIGQNLKANVIESIEAKNKADIFVYQEWNTFSIQNSKIMNEVESVSLSIIYNGENLSISDIHSSYGSIDKLENEEGVHSLILNLKPQVSLEKNTKIVEFQATKNTNNQTEHINIVNANFKDAPGSIYSLSTSGISF